MILILDNYDSFTWNLVHLVAAEAEARVIRNDELSVPELLALEPAGVLLSPGPGRPGEAGVMEELLRAAPPNMPFLGVCLGMQAIAEVHGARVVRAPTPVHGKTNAVHHDERTIFTGVPQSFLATRYHSLCVAREALPDELEVSAWSDDGVVMALRHGGLPLEGVQFHPESALTTEGPRIVANWIRSCRQPAAA